MPFDNSPEAQARREAKRQAAKQKRDADRRAKADREFERFYGDRPRHDPMRIERSTDYPVDEFASWYINDIIVGDRLRGIDEAKVKELEDSISKLGLLEPIVVTLAPGQEDDGNSKVRLVDGAHRLEAVKRLGHTMIRMAVAELDAVEAKMAEIDANLVRNELSQAERVEHEKLYKELWEQRNGEVKTGGSAGATCLSDGRKAGPQHQKGYAAERSEKTGRSKAAINKDIARGERIATDVLAVIKSKPELNTGAAMDKLMVLPHNEQREVVAGQRPLDAAPAPEREVPPEPVAAAAPEDARQDAAQAEPEAAQSAETAPIADELVAPREATPLQGTETLPERFRLAWETFVEPIFRQMSPAQKVAALRWLNDPEVAPVEQAPVDTDNHDAATITDQPAEPEQSGGTTGNVEPDPAPAPEPQLALSGDLMQRRQKAVQDKATALINVRGMDPDAAFAAATIFVDKQYRKLRLRPAEVSTSTPAEAA